GLAAPVKQGHGKPPQALVAWAPNRSNPLKAGPVLVAVVTQFLVKPGRVDNEIGSRLECFDGKRVRAGSRRRRRVAVDFEPGSILPGGEAGAAVLDPRFVEGVFDTAVAVILYADPYDGVFCRKNNGIVKAHVANDARNALGTLAIHAQGRVYVEGPGQNNHVVKTVIRQI